MDIKILAIASLAVASKLIATQLDITIDTEKTYQSIDNFAASDAWSGNFAGQYFDERQKNQIAKWRKFGLNAKTVTAISKFFSSSGLKYSENMPAKACISPTSHFPGRFT